MGRERAVPVALFPAVATPASSIYVARGVVQLLPWIKKSGEYCQAPFSRLTSLYVNLQFDVAVTLKYYYGHQEQVTLSLQQQVCCIPTGNCTSS
uniref:Uncharacterized protein n=1 Tax=Ditylenchus dipsaci TaxID=166011 RepID=A0A915CMV4_9BILA